MRSIARERFVPIAIGLLVGVLAIWGIWEAFSHYVQANAFKEAIRFF